MNLELRKLNEMNNQCVDLILEDKNEEALSILKKAESILENIALNPETKIDKKLLILILHNIACSYQKMKDYENCVVYLEAVIFHFDGLLESKHGIKINFEYFSKVKNQTEANLYTPEHKLGDIILQMRFSAKFHLQMCAVLSQANSHKEALEHAKISVLICEDNLTKTFQLFNEIKHKILNKDHQEEDLSAFEEKMKEMLKIVEDLNNKIQAQPMNWNERGGNCKNNHHKILKKEEIENFVKNENFKISVRNILGVKKADDWINYLNIGNIMYLSALNYEDLDLDSDPKFELLRDAVLEKIVMLTVSYFCIATEFRFQDSALSKLKKYSRVDQAEYWHSKAVEYSCIYLPNCCPLIKHYISSYHKHYTNNLETIPEDEMVDNEIEIIRSNVNTDQDPVLPFKEVQFEKQDFNSEETKPKFNINLNILNPIPVSCENSNERYKSCDEKIESSKNKFTSPNLKNSNVQKIIPLKLTNLLPPKKAALSDRTKKDVFLKDVKMKPLVTDRIFKNPNYITSNLNFNGIKAKPPIPVNIRKEHSPLKQSKSNLKLKITLNPNVNINKKTSLKTNNDPLNNFKNLNINNFKDFKSPYHKEALITKFSTYLPKKPIQLKKIASNGKPVNLKESITPCTNTNSATITESEKSKSKIKSNK